MPQQSDFVYRFCKSLLLSIILFCSLLLYGKKQFFYQVNDLPPKVKSNVLAKSWHPECPTKIEDLRLVKVSYFGFDNTTHTGQLIVHKEIAQDVVEIFQELFAARFPIEKMRLINAYNGSDDLSMKDNNTSAFNCRKVSDSKRWSWHAYGKAIDINPLQNPVVYNFRKKNKKIAPPGGRKYLNRKKQVKGMITKDSAAYRIFRKRNWSWGGDWYHIKDYQHFVKKYTCKESFFNKKISDLQMKKSSLYYHLGLTRSFRIEIKKLLQKISGKTLAEKLRITSEQFLGRYFGISPNGEGNCAYFDRNPVLRNTVFDCLTYVETVLAIVHSQNLDQVISNFVNIRYKNGIVGFTNKNIFFSGEWMPSNIQKNYVADITRNVFKKLSQTKKFKKLAENKKKTWYLRLRWTKAELDKNGLFQKFSKREISRPYFTVDEKLELHDELRNECNTCELTTGTIPYIPIQILREPTFQKEIIDAIPQGSLVVIVRPNWDRVEKNGTRLNVSHVQFYFKNDKGEPVLRHASSRTLRVSDDNFFEYFNEMKKYPSIQGINILQVKENL